MLCFFLGSGVYYSRLYHGGQLALGVPVIAEAFFTEDGVATTEVPFEKININTADEVTLMILPRVGAKTAEAILLYREANGAFTEIEGIMNVSGIGEKTFEEIKDKITVQ